MRPGVPSRLSLPSLPLTPQHPLSVRLLRGGAARLLMRITTKRAHEMTMGIRRRLQSFLGSQEHLPCPPRPRLRLLRCGHKQQLPTGRRAHVFPLGQRGGRGRLWMSICRRERSMREGQRMGRSAITRGLGRAERCNISKWFDEVTLSRWAGDGQKCSQVWHSKENC